MSNSIRVRVLVLLFLLVTATWFSLAGLTYQSSATEIRKLLDAHLAETGQLIVITVRHEYAENDTKGYQADLHVHEYQHSVSFRVWSRDGKPLLTSSKDLPEALADVPSGFSDLGFNGDKWRVFSFVDTKHGHRIVVADRYGDRDVLSQRVLSKVLKPFFWLLPILAVILWYGVGKGLAPLDRLARDIAGRSYACLDPVDAGGVPREVVPLVEEINSLFKRLRDAFVRFSQFTADAAHELRTPLAGIQMQAVAARRTQDAGERERALCNVQEGSVRAAHLIEQLLDLARVEPEDEQKGFSPQDLGQIASEVLERLSCHALEKGIDIDLEAEPGVVVSGNADYLRLMLRNLVDNAIRYTPEGGRVMVRIGGGADGAYARVVDTGPGIPEHERERVFERFYRLGEGPGAGLGLSIIQRVAHLHGADMTLDSGPEGIGLSASVRFAYPA